MTATLKKFRRTGGKHLDDYGRQYLPGEVIASEKDLDRLFENVFVRVEDSTPDKYHGQLVPTANSLVNQATPLPTGPVAKDNSAKKRTIPNDILLDLEAMTPSELQKLATDEEIDLKGATKKPDMIRLIKEAAAKSAQ